MKQKLSFKEYIYVASMLFGMFFGAGNLIFPVYMGQVAGRNMWAAVFRHSPVRNDFLHRGSGADPAPR